MSRRERVLRSIASSRGQTLAEYALSPDSIHILVSNTAISYFRRSYTAETSSVVNSKDDLSNTYRVSISGKS
jgi:hypothetical protein